MSKTQGWLGAAILGLAIAVTPARAASPVVKGAVILLQSENVIGQRIESVDAMAGYIKAVFAAVDTRLATVAGRASSGSIFIALHAGRRAHAWVGFEPPLSPDIAAAIADAVATAPGLSVRGGTVVFALNIGLWGAKPPEGRTGPLPDDWRAAGAKSGKAHLGAADLADLAWASEAKGKTKTGR